MAGIVNFGAYVPVYRLSGETAAKTWGGRGSADERAVANHDEDSVTMAVEAVLKALGSRDPKTVDGLLFASTTPPYSEKQNSTIVATVADLPKEVYTADFGNSLRAGTSALRAALDAVKSGSARNMLVAAADCRMVEAGSENELVFGDGAAALLVGNEDVALEVEGIYSVNAEFTDQWRRNKDAFVRTGDARFNQVFGYEGILREAVNGALKKFGVTREEISKIVYHAPDARTHRGLCQTLGWQPTATPDGKLFSTVGNTGTSFVFLSLIQALEDAKQGDRILLASYGQGSDVFLLRATDKLGALVRDGLKAQIASKRALANYGKFLKFRQLVQEERITPYSSQMMTWRDQKANLPLYGTHCTKCGLIQFPMRKVCWNCGSREVDDVKLAHRGSIVTYANDYLLPSPETPTPMVVADLEGGGRFYGQFTDTDPAEIKVGLPVELTFRRFHEGEGFINYFWKIRGVR